jgi:hypothetical protein
MATLKIYRSQAQTGNVQVPQFGQLAIPIEYAQQQGKAISQIGKVYEQFKAEERETINENRASEIKNEINKKIATAYGSVSNLTDLNQAEAIMNQAFEAPDLTSENRQVQKLVKDYLSKKQTSIGLDVFKTVTTNYTNETQNNKSSVLSKLAIDRASNDPYVRAVAEKEMDVFFQSKENYRLFGPKGLEKLKLDSELLTKELQVKFRTKNDPMATLASEQEIFTTFGPQKGAAILEEARAKLTANNINERKYLELEHSNTVAQQSTNFTVLADRFVDARNHKDNKDLLGELPTFDQLYDYKREGKISESQYNLLIRVANDESIDTDIELINLINNDLITSKTTADIQQLQEVVNSNDDILKNIDVKDIASFNKIISKLKNDPTKFDEYKEYANILKINMGDIGGAASILFGSGGITNQDKIETATALNQFNQLVLNNYKPQEAYLKVLGTITKEKVPTLDSANFKPVNVRIDNMLEHIKKNPQDAFQSLETDLATKLKNKQITILDFKQDIERLDLLKDVYEVRKKINNDPTFIFQAAGSQGFNLSLGDIKNK